MLHLLHLIIERVVILVHLVVVAMNDDESKRVVIQVEQVEKNVINEVSNQNGGKNKKPYPCFFSVDLDLCFHVMQ